MSNFGVACPAGGDAVRFRCRRGTGEAGPIWPLDGTKVRANASRNKAMSYGRMKEKEAQLKAEVAELLPEGRGGGR